eukprot:s1217_g12.t1
MTRKVRANFLDQDMEEQGQEGQNHLSAKNVEIPHKLFQSPSQSIRLGLLTAFGRAGTGEARGALPGRAGGQMSAHHGHPGTPVHNGDSGRPPHGLRTKCTGVVRSFIDLRMVSKWGFWQEYWLADA